MTDRHLAWRTCELCGHSANEPAIQPSVALMDLGDGRPQFMDVIRCKRVDDCRARADAAGRGWPLVSTKVVAVDKPRGVRRAR